MIIQPLKILTAILITGIILLSGCTAPQEEEDEPTGLTEIRFGYQPSTHQVAYMIADAKDWWLEDLAPYGITSTKENQFPSGAPEMQAMLAGEIDVAYVGAAPVIPAIDQGLEAKIVAGVNSQGSDLVIAKDLSYESPEDLKGLVIGTYPPSTMQPTVLKKWLVDNGIDPDNDLTIKHMGGPALAVSAFSSGDLDAVFLPHPFPTILESEGTGKIVVQSGEMWEGHACCVMLVSEKLIKEHPDIVEQIVRTHINATQYSLENPDETVQIFSDKIKYPYEIVNKSMHDWDGHLITDPSVGIDSVLDFARAQYELGYTDKLLTQDDLFDISFYNKIMDEE